MQAAVHTAPPQSTAPGAARPFPVYPSLVERLVDPNVVQPDRIVARTLATAAMYEYSDDQGVLQTAMARLGLGEQCAVTKFHQQVDAMLVSSTAFLIQSEDRRLGI